MKDEMCLALSYPEKWEVLAKLEVSKEVYDYLNNILNDLYVYIGENEQGKIMDLMSNKKLMGWCWESTESSIVFFNDYDTIERGYLYGDDNNPEYYHSWIRFKYKDDQYIFDPGLSIISTIPDYYKLFNPRIEGRVTSKIVKQEFIKQNSEYMPDLSSLENIKIKARRMHFNLGDDYIRYIENKAQKFQINHYRANPNDPFFINTAGYESEIEGNKIKKMQVHYYPKIDD